MHSGATNGGNGEAAAALAASIGAAGSCDEVVQVSLPGGQQVAVVRLQGAGMAVAPALPPLDPLASSITAHKYLV